MKYKINWHKNCLENMKRSLAEEERHLQYLKETIFKDKTKVDFYKKQIETAERMLKEGFDSDKFLVKKIKKVIQGDLCPECKQFIGTNTMCSDCARFRSQEVLL